LLPWLCGREFKRRAFARCRSFGVEPLDLQPLAMAAVTHNLILPPGGSGLHIESRLNGRMMQSANTSDMVFGATRAASASYL